jgi:hypothetical protein
LGFPSAHEGGVLGGVTNRNGRLRRVRGGFQISSKNIRRVSAALHQQTETPQGVPDGTSPGGE